MIFFGAALMAGLSFWLALRLPAREPTLGDRLAEAAFAPTACIAMVTVILAALSLRWVGQDLTQATIGELRALETGIPNWAKDISDVLPKWYHNALLAVVALGVAAYRSRAAASELPGLDRQQRVIARMRTAGNWATGISCALFAASVLRMFGDGVVDMEGDIQSELHAAELRFNTGTDVAVRQLSAEVVEQTVAALRTYQPQRSASWAATQEALRDFRSSFNESQGQPRPSVRQRQWSLRSRSFPEKSLEILWPTPPETTVQLRLPPPKARLQALEQLTALRDIDSDSSSTAVAESLRSSFGVSADAPDVDVSALRDNLPRNAIKEMGGTNERVSERRELAKELIASATDELKRIAGSDPLVVLFGEAVTPLINEVLSSVTTKGVLEPLLARWWRSGGADDARKVIKAEVNAQVARANLAEHWQRVAATSSRYVGAATAMRDTPTDNEIPLSIDDRLRLIRVMLGIGRHDLAERIDLVPMDGDDAARLNDVLSAGEKEVISRGMLAHHAFSPSDAQPPNANSSSIFGKSPGQRRVPGFDPSRRRHAGPSTELPRLPRPPPRPLPRFH